MPTQLLPSTLLLLTAGYLAERARQGMPSPGAAPRRGTRTGFSTALQTTALNLRERPAARRRLLASLPLALTAAFLLWLLQPLQLAFGDIYWSTHLFPGQTSLGILLNLFGAFWMGNLLAR